ncbi:MAG: transglutaminase-like domain-containing protein [candidate division KSB1 bacterium]|nr:transglutaminase-like domain-containing protein [candidate division KSB1 bacterium]MDZ7273014.1 transglutaminase-like domain-containing protein [candidate division KSB1 bacterium]MDZ7285117.1 transglutaminase-like domain-containing protein [candidate division KSB1 bacterium]MDZ7298149.1 transglutaminase-like domain-containing protein [candidate division KSB1 bacterium]MDZ7306903.1 transglutaminase-like domain-containing protein [candidate division KSB1 bacterium]
MKKSASEIQALITLLGDEDAKIRSIAREHLLQIGQEAEGFLRQAARDDGDGRTRIEARHVLAQIHREDLISSFYVLGLLEEEQIDLEHAAFLLARVGYPDLDLAPLQRELDGFAERIRVRLAEPPHTQPGRVIVETINHVLFVEERFRGNVEEYYDPDNSYLNRVIERRTGIPVSLSVLYLLIARRLQVPVHGVNLPVHFICRYQTPEESFLIDPFYGGRLITRAECMKLLQGSGMTFEDRMLQRAAPRTIIARMVRNLILIHSQRDELAQATFLDRILKMLRTQEP